MRYNTRDLLTLLISLFILGSCKNPSGIGLDVLPGDEIIGHLTDTLTLHTVTLKDDSAQSASFNQTTFGILKDPTIGKTVADVALGISRPTTVPRIKPEAEIDSVILVLPYGTEYFGDTLQSTFTIQVRQLSEVFTGGTYSTKQWAANLDVIGSKTVSRFAYKDSLSISRHMDDKDSVVKVIPQLRVALSGTFFKNLLSSSVDSASLSTGTGFVNHVKGLYISVEDGSQEGLGGLVTLKGVADLSGVELTYRQPNGKEGDDADTDTIRAFLPITAAALASSVKHEYTDEVQEQLQQPTGNFETVYLQASAGLRSKVTLPHIDSLKGRNMTVNKAELVIYVDSETSGTDFSDQAPRLTLYREDIASQRQPVPDGDTRYNSNNQFIGDPRSLQTGFGGVYDKDKKRYVFFLTSYVQDLLLGKINGYDIYLAPASMSEQNVPYWSVMNTGSRSVIGGGSNADFKMKLNIYYTESGN